MSGLGGGDDGCFRETVAALDAVAICGGAEVAIRLAPGTVLKLAAASDAYRVDHGSCPIGWLPREVADQVRCNEARGYAAAVGIGTAAGSALRPRVTVVMVWVRKAEG